MKFSFLAYDPVPTRSDLARMMQRVADLGYHGIELAARHPLEVPIEEVVALSREYRLPVVSLLSGWSYDHEGLCLSSPDAALRQRAVDRLIDYVGHASLLNSLVVVGLMQGLRRDEPDESKAKERIAGCLQRVAKAAEARNVSIVIEPVNHLQVGFNHTAAEAAAMASRVGSPALGFMLDTIHMNIEERSVIGTTREYGARARHFHLCETNGGAYGSGGLDFPAVLAALRQVGYDRYCSVKVYRQISSWEEAAASAAAFLRKAGATLRT
jgi:sugar phosphate isomerase/epimerase